MSGLLSTGHARSVPDSQICVGQLFVVVVVQPRQACPSCLGVGQPCLVSSIALTAHRVTPGGVGQPFLLGVVQPRTSGVSVLGRRTRLRPVLCAIAYAEGMVCSSWATEMARSLVGEPVELPDTKPEAPAILAALEVLGWSPAKIRAFALSRFEAEMVWPLPVSEAVIAAGPAQWYALQGEARTLLGLDGLQQPPATRTVLNADERRLLGDVPPHW